MKVTVEPVLSGFPKGMARVTVYYRFTGSIQVDPQIAQVVWCSCVTFVLTVHSRKMTYKELRIFEFTVLASISGDKHGILIWLERLKWKLTYLEGKNFGTLTSDRLIQIPLYLWWRMELFRMSSVILPCKTVRNWGYGDRRSTLKPPKRMSYFLVLFQTHWVNTFKIDIPNRYLNYFNYFANVRAGKEQ